jgi:hypothetical protein
MADDRLVLDRDLLAMIDGYHRRIEDRGAPRSADLDAVEQIVALDPVPDATPAPEPPRPRTPTPAVDGGPSLETLVDGWGMIWEDARLLRSPAFEETPAVGHAREFLADAAGGGAKILILSGTKGVGKTVAASWLMLVARPDLGGKAWPTDRHPRICTAAKIARWGAFGHDDERHQLARAKVTVIDDLGMEDPKARGFVAYLGELVNERAGAPGLTVLTTNLTPAELMHRYTTNASDAAVWDRIWDRLNHRALWFDVAHASLRTR